MEEGMFVVRFCWHNGDDLSFLYVQGDIEKLAEQASTHLVRYRDDHPGEVWVEVEFHARPPQPGKRSYPTFCKGRGYAAAEFGVAWAESPHETPSTEVILAKLREITIGEPE